ncbi:putative carboxylesterase [Helianthus debilis subsp. tardiflorus]
MLHTYFQGTEPIGPELAKDRDFKAGTDLTWKLASKARVGLDDPMFNPAKDPRISKFGCSRILMCVAEKDKCLFRALNYKKVMEKSGWMEDLRCLRAKGRDMCSFCLILHPKMHALYAKELVISSIRSLVRPERFSC